MKSEKLSNFLGLCLIVAILLAVGAFFVVKPSITRSSATSAKISQTNSDIASLHTLQSKTETLRQNYEAIKDRRDQILHQLPVKSEVERLLALLSSLGQQSGVVVSSFIPTTSGAASSTGSSISPYPVAISVNGSYVQQQDFLRRIENGARFIDLQSASYSASLPGALSSSLVLQAYYQNDTATNTTTGGAK